MSLKKCNSCGETKSLDDFHNRTNRKSGKYSQCRDCNRKRVKEWRKQNRKRAVDLVRKSYLKQTYGITEEQYYELLDKQNECCAICKRHASEFNKRLAVDHEHGEGRPTSGMIRGLLCEFCNRRLIGRHKDPELFRNAAEYLEGPFTGWVVPKKKKRKKRKT